MPSITDIPEHLLRCTAKQGFLKWLKFVYTDMLTKKELLFLWADYTDCPITPDDLEYVFGKDYKERGI